MRGISSCVDAEVLALARDPRPSFVLHDERHPVFIARLGRDAMDAPSRVDAAVTVDEGFGERDRRQAEVPRERVVRAFGGVGGGRRGGGESAGSRAAASPARARPNLPEKIINRRPPVPRRPSAPGG